MPYSFMHEVGIDAPYCQYYVLFDIYIMPFFQKIYSELCWFCFLFHLGRQDQQLIFSRRLASYDSTPCFEIFTELKA